MLLSLHANKEISLGRSGCLDDWHSDFIFWIDWATKILMSFRKFLFFFLEGSVIGEGFLHDPPLTGSASACGGTGLSTGWMTPDFYSFSYS